MSTALVTGASRGIGLELADQLAAAGWRVVATARAPDRSTELTGLADRWADVDAVPLDVDRRDSAAACARWLEARAIELDLLVNNAGLWDVAGAATSGPLAALDPDALLALLRTNALGAVVVTQALAGRLVPGATVANLSSGLGSLGRDVPRRNFGYAQSKAALNMATRYLAAELGERGVTVVALDPGWVRTDLGGDEAPVAVETSVAQLREVLARLAPEDNGAWLNRHGKPVEW